MNLAIRQESMKQHGYTNVDNRVYDTQPFISPSAFAMLMRIDRMTNGYQDDVKALSNTFLQELCNMTKNTVSKYVDELVEIGILVAHKRSRKTTIYAIDYQRLFVFVDESQTLGSQTLTKCIPNFDLVESQTLGRIKLKLNKNLLNKNNTGEKPKKTSHLRLITDNKNSGQKKPSVKPKSKPSVKTKFDPVKYPVPSFVDQELWLGYHEMRKTIKKPATERACELLVKDFGIWHSNGLDVNSAIKKSIISGWTGIFEPAQRIQPNQTQGNTSENTQPDNSQHQPPKQSSSSKYDEQLARELSERFPDEFAMYDHQDSNSEFV